MFDRSCAAALALIVLALGTTDTGLAAPSPATPGPTMISESFWGFKTAQVRFDASHTDAKAAAWAVRSFIKTGSLDVAFAQLVEAPAAHPHATVYCTPVKYAGEDGLLISVALLGKDPSRSEKLRSGEHVVLRLLQRHAKSFEAPRQYLGETQ